MYITIKFIFVIYTKNILKLYTHTHLKMRRGLDINGNYHCVSFEKYTDEYDELIEYTEIVTYYDKYTVVLSEETYTTNNFRRQSIGKNPAIIKYDHLGNVEELHYYENGFKGRIRIPFSRKNRELDKPSSVYFGEDYSVRLEYYIQGNLSRKKGKPAIMEFNFPHNFKYNFDELGESYLKYLVNFKYYLNGIELTSKNVKRIIEQKIENLSKTHRYKLLI